MNCPVCKKSQLKAEIFHNTEVDYCPFCLGLWFEEGELRIAKDEKDKDLNWMDLDLWKNAKEFKISASQKRICPSCRMPLYEAYYKDSGIIIDVCNLCHGIWLDRAEFKKITDWLKERADYEILHNYSGSLLKQFGEVFSGPDTLKEELSDVLTVLKMLKYKVLTQAEELARIIMSLPK
ncbi:MAG: hypothetical protein A2365_03255 [Candidatus Nealsonbacteria bacterium RIFOXYB1_FULL_40_15]|uniref:Transcription factor zinc-finger domain-containing protein n=2 Tax=Candidatus Nealsoniibacteriota TaxID=1817911 RepID=A0A1G2EV57_9BACT|nr:MAG: hypothetical protein A2365_03255 [Candidatus Nealsonbacteria bacterium RIFOXYB1_FULL_40_15]OGZ29241.1 MAG: hypothetical protein A2427_03115 [Candidatus Nealsonbacteria bacterium RIFOXYC1_FULL_40_7]OGZ29394.1 MAG: hypothetical protein A2562_04785 [Candidatus Nealsonbacteria bacterium RIFOXYD1_FULL_39_11]